MTHAGPASIALVEVVALLLLIFAQLPFLLSGDAAPLTVDYGGIFLGPLFQVREALLDAQALFWDPIRYGGTPYWALPNTAPAYPPLVASLLVLGPLAATNLVLILHLLLGAWGTRALARGLGASRSAAFVAAATFLFAPFSLYYGQHQPWATMALAFLPWTLLQVVRFAQGADWRTRGVTAGLLYAATVWCGGYVVFLPGLMAVGLLTLFLSVGRRAPRKLLGSAGMLLVMVLVLVTVSAGRLLPSMAWTRVTDRVDGLSLATAIGDAFTLRDVLTWTCGTGVLTVGLATIAVFAAARGRRSVLPLAATVLVLVLFTLGWPQRLFFHRFVPGFDRVRDPRHFWEPLVVLVPVLAAIGLDALRAGLAHVPTLAERLRGPVGLVCLSTLVIALGAETRAWGVVPIRPVIVLDERIAANALHLDLAGRAASDPRFRVHDAFDTRPKAKPTADLLRCALGLESIEGHLGNISVLDYDRDFIVPSRVQGPRLWGLLGCVYVTSESPLDDPGLELVQVFPEDPDEIQPGTDGPYLYRNRHALPRAFLAHRAVLLLDVGIRGRQRALVSQGWDPEREVLVRADLDEVEPTRDFFARFHTVVGAGRVPGDEELVQTIRDAGARFRSLPPTGEEEQLRADLATGDGPPNTALTDPTRQWNGARIDLGTVAQDSWLVLAETYAIYPGWRASVDGTETPLRIANGAATAIPIPAGANEVTLTYVPPGLRIGMIVTAFGLALSAAALVLLARRDRLREDSLL